MPDYKEMYLTLFRATEKAARILISAQQACEEMYVAYQEPELTVLPATEKAKIPEDSRSFD